MSDFNASPRRKIALDNNKLKLYTNCPSAEGKRSSLSWGIHKNNPRITIYTGDPADQTARTNNGRIQAELDMGLVQIVFQLLEQSTTEAAGWKKQIKCFNYTFFGGKRSDKPQNTADIWIGKDKDGLSFISVVDPHHSERPVIKFPIAPDWSWVKLFHSDGTQLSKEEASNMFTKGYANLLRDLYTHLAVTEFVPYEAPQKNGSGGGGYNRGGQGGGNGGGGYQRNNQGGNGGGGRNSDVSDDSDDDSNLPF